MLSQYDAVYCIKFFMASPTPERKNGWDHIFVVVVVAGNKVYKKHQAVAS